MLSSKLLSTVALALALASAPALAGHSMSKRADAKHTKEPVRNPGTKPAAKPASSGKTSVNGHICFDLQRCLKVYAYTEATTPGIMGYSFDTNKPVAPSDAAIFTLQNGLVHYYPADPKLSSTLAANGLDLSLWLATDAKIKAERVDIKLKCSREEDDELDCEYFVQLCEGGKLIVPNQEHSKDPACKTQELFWIPAAATK